jgi:hypothetical protein
LLTGDFVIDDDVVHLQINKDALIDRKIFY